MVDAADAPVLAVLTRAPSAGGKTRLFAELGRPVDPTLLQALLLDTLEGAAVPGVRRVVAVTPRGACAEVQELLGSASDVRTLPQEEGDLGARIRAVMETLFEEGARAVALIGSDLPHITAARIVEAFQLLEEDPKALVLGPAADGGYYLIAARHVPRVFAGIDWGSALVLQQTERAAAADGRRVHRVASLADVDTADTLRRAAASGRAVRTAAWLQSARAPTPRRR
jgi:rSAM/selenodomain-associated transferase 1